MQKWDLLYVFFVVINQDLTQKMLIILSDRSVFLGLFYKIDLNFWDCFRREKTHLIAKLHKIDIDVWGMSLWAYLFKASLA